MGETYLTGEVVDVTVLTIFMGESYVVTNTWLGTTFIRDVPTTDEVENLLVRLELIEILEDYNYESFKLIEVYDNFLWIFSFTSLV